MKDVENIRLLDVTGKIVYKTTKVSNGSISIDLTNVSQGLYFIQVETNDKLESFKVIKR